MRYAYNLEMALRRSNAVRTTKLVDGRPAYEADRTRRGNIIVRRYNGATTSFPSAVKAAEHYDMYDWEPIR